MEKCRVCGQTFFNRFSLDICNKCVEVERQATINNKLDDIRELYTVEQRLRAIERWIFSIGEKGLRYE